MECNPASCINDAVLTRGEMGPDSHPPGNLDTEGSRGGHSLAHGRVRVCSEQRESTPTLQLQGSEQEDTSLQAGQGRVAWSGGPYGARERALGRGRLAVIVKGEEGPSGCLQLGVELRPRRSCCVADSQMGTREMAPWTPSQDSGTPGTMAFQQDLFMYFTDRKGRVTEEEGGGEREREREVGGVFQSLIDSPNACHGWSWARLKPGVLNSIQRSHVRGRDPGAGAAVCCLPGSWVVSGAAGTEVAPIRDAGSNTGRRLRYGMPALIQDAGPDMGYQL